MTDAMPAGREMDALVAEKVMAQPVYHHAGSKDICHCKINGDDDITICEGPVKKYSTDIAAAWEVAVHMHMIFAVRFAAGCVEGDQWYCEIGAGPIFQGIANIAPLAICRAALKAVGA